MAPSDTPATFESFQAELARLVAQFDRQHPTYTSPDYNEAAVRADFLDPFFRALGWDVGNQKGLIHTEREVAIEVRTHLSGKQTRADYVFRHARTERFTCEAKKPAEVLHNRHILQAKKDAFARGVPLALLSDFEELKIYIVGARPLLDEPHVGEWKVLHFKQYTAAAREIWDLLAYDSVSTGSIDRLIDSLPKRPLRLKGRQGYLIKPDRTRALDADFLNFLDDVRQQLGSDLLKHNDRADLLEGHRLNEAAQRIIDRLVFLRICEDRGIDTGTLLQTLFDGWHRQQPEATKPKLRRPGKQTHMRFGGALEEEPPAAAYGARGRTEGGLYREITDHIRALDQRPPSYKPFFNGQLFKPHFSEDLTVGDEWLANFLLDLVDDDNGYNFADIKVEILGDAYERFLGKVLRPQGRGATIEEKPEVRKAGGVYYTPRYITDYIVRQTVGRLLEGKTPKQAEKLKIVDPACGSGSFLLRAYEEVMDHHLRWFTANPDKRNAKDCYVDAAGDVRLTTALKRRILENNIHGVDIDAQAVEVTQLSLYLKMLEGENRETLRAQTELFREQPLLPPLDKNIKCFNSLIASDFSLDPAELVRVNAGDWDVQFPEIMNVRVGGFDAVIGNPPYVVVAPDSFDPAQSAYLRRYQVAQYKADLFHLFIERGLGLCQKHGKLGMIVPNTWLTLQFTDKLRDFVLRNSKIEQLVVLDHLVFAEADVFTALLFLEKSMPGPSHETIVKRVRVATTAAEVSAAVSIAVSQSSWLKNQGFTIETRRLNPGGKLVERLIGCFPPLEKIARASLGAQAYNSSKHTKEQIEGRVFHAEKKLGAAYMLEIGGSAVSRYQLQKDETKWIKYGPWLHDYREMDWLTGPRILIREIAGKVPHQIFACYAEEILCNYKTVLNVNPSRDTRVSMKYLLGLLNSRLLSFVYPYTSTKQVVASFPRLSVRDIKQLPISVPKLDQATGKQLHDRLVALVDKMLTLTPALRAAKADAEKTTLQNALTKTDREIDQLVYQLYGLTPEEIALVEGAGNPAAPVEAD
jgi:hypothetical protein